MQDHSKIKGAAMLILTKAGNSLELEILGKVSYYILTLQQIGEILLGDSRY